jgi:hypothetical protein
MNCSKHKTTKFHFFSASSLTIIKQINGSDVVFLFHNPHTNFNNKLEKVSFIITNATQWIVSMSKLQSADYFCVWLVYFIVNWLILIFLIVLFSTAKKNQKPTTKTNFRFWFIFQKLICSSISAQVHTFRGRQPHVFQKIIFTFLFILSNKTST